MKTSNSRTIATLIISEIIFNKNTLNYALDKYVKTTSSLTQKDLSFIKALCFGVLRNFLLLEFILKHVTLSQIKPKDKILSIVIFIGIYQLLFMQVKEYAAVDSTVAICNDLQKKSAKSFVNALLRKFIQNKEQILILSKQNKQANFLHPKWLINKINTYWIDHLDSIIKTNNSHPPYTARVNIQKITPQELRNILLEKYEIKSDLINNMPSALIIHTNKNVIDLVEFKDGLFSIQDIGAQIAANLLDLKANLTILDACAAPGGKTCHILEQEPNLKSLTTLDINHKKICFIQDNLNRLKLKANLHTATLQTFITNIWDGRTFDRILLDVPCSGTGVIRRHPEIKFLRNNKQISELITLQQELLNLAWNLLSVKGILIYATCSILKEENEQIISNFISKTKDSKIININLPFGLQQQYGTQILPGMNNSDGFYYAKIYKVSNYIK